MKKRILLISIFFIIVIVVVTVIFGIYEHNLNSNSTINNQIVDINEIEQLYKNGNSELASKKLTDLQEYLRSTRSKSVDYSSLIMKEISDKRIRLKMENHNQNKIIKDLKNDFKGYIIIN